MWAAVQNQDCQISNDAARLSRMLPAKAGLVSLLLSQSIKTLLPEICWQQGPEVLVLRGHRQTPLKVCQLIL